MIDKIKEFLDLAKKMNQQLGIIPLLFGSVALNMYVKNDVKTGDLDIALPNFMRPDRKYLCPEYIIFMEKMVINLLIYGKVNLTKAIL